MAPPRKKDFPCIRCDNHVPKVGAALQCSMCDLWAHKACTGIDDNVYDYIVNQQKHQGGHVLWACASCLAFASKFNAKIRDFEKRFDSMEESVTNQATAMKDVQDSLSTVEASLKSMKESVTKVTVSADASDKGKQASTTEVLKEMEERKARQSIVIIHGLSEPNVTIKDKDERIEADKAKISDLLGEIEIDDDKDNIVFAKRLGARPKEDDEAPRPLRVGFKTAVQQSSVVEAARKIDRKGDGEFSKVSVVPDITRLQRQEELALRKEADRLNAEDPTEPKNSVWKVVGKRGERRLVQLKPKTTPEAAPQHASPIAQQATTPAKSPWKTPDQRRASIQPATPPGNSPQNVTTRPGRKSNRFHL